jgi:5-methyltetrahydropteroyltriglutamate--homocysteine methyltransferase
MPSWLERLKTEYSLRKISKAELDEVHDGAVKAAIKDQEMAGVDIVTDGEMRRDNMIDYFAERLPGVDIDQSSKQFYYDFFDSVVRGKLPIASLGLVDDFTFLRANTLKDTKFCVTGPHSLVKRIRNEHYATEEEFALDVARVMNVELKELVRAGADRIQVDEPYYSGFPQDLEWGVKALNALVDGVDAKIVLHICYGNRYGKPSWAGNYRYLFPTILDANVQQLTLEFAWRGGEDLDLFKEFPNQFELGVGTIDVKSDTVETPDIVAERIRSALKFVSPERVTVLPDCGCHNLAQPVALGKLRAMVEGAQIVRNSLGG